MKRLLLLSVLAGFAASTAVQGQTTRFEWEEAGSPVSFNGMNLQSDFTANRSMSHVGDFANADLGWTFSNGHSHHMSDSWGTPGPSSEFIFSGTGVTFRALGYGNGDESVAWRLEGANGQIVNSSTLNLQGAAANIDVVVAAPGSLPAGLYKLVVEPGWGESGNLVLLDYADVSDNAITRIEENSTSITYSSAWISGDTFGKPSGGTQAVQSTPGAWLSVPFERTDIAVVTPFNPAMGVFDWTIDDGLAGSGTVDLGAGRYAPAAWTDVRVSTILAKGLSNGPHVLKLTIAAGNTKNVYIDAFDTNGTFTPVELSAFELE